MLTVDFDRLDVGPGDLVLDLGCGAGRHSFEVHRRGADVVAVDRDPDEVAATQGWLAAIDAEQPELTGATGPLVGDALRLPFADATFDVVVAAEILEHIHDDRAAMDELHRVLRPGGRAAVTVPRFGPELVCWTLSDAYHEVEGGHVRIYRRRQLVERLEAAGLRVRGGHHHAHALHSPYWWLKCLVGLDREDALPVRLYHRLLVWDLERAPRVTRLAERALDPLMGKSLVLYLERPREGVRAAA